MAQLGELRWLSDPTGAVRVAVGLDEYLVVTSEHAARAGDDQLPGVVPLGAALTTTTSATPYEWTTLFAPAERQEAYVSCVHVCPSTMVLVDGGADGPIPIWPDSPGYVTHSWKGSIRIMSPGVSVWVGGFQV